MLTVIVGFDGSGKRSTRRPFASRYSVIPSTDATRSGASVDAAAGAAGAGAGCCAPSGAATRAARRAPQGRARIETSGRKERAQYREGGGSGREWGAVP